MKATNPSEQQVLDECVKKTQDILREFEMEGNIPIGHEYWKILNRIRTLTQRKEH